MILGVSTTPRRTWLWSPDPGTAIEVRRILESHNCEWHPAEQGGVESSTVTDIDIGVVALESLEVLVAAGVSFQWADQQALENRSATLYGVPVAAADDA